MQFSKGLSFDPITRSFLTQAIFWTSGWLIDRTFRELPWMPFRYASDLTSHIYTCWQHHEQLIALFSFVLWLSLFNFYQTKKYHGGLRSNVHTFLCFLWIRRIPHSNRSVVEAMEFSRSFVDKLVWHLMTIGAPKVLWQKMAHIKQLLCTKIFACIMKKQTDGCIQIMMHWYI